jgi:putative methionine-R-sulfoxide reductase with GAF domain/two-component sensor histidine kinase
MQQPPQVWLSNFKLFDKDSIEGFRLNSLTELKLTHTQNYFSFSFVSPSLIYPEAMQYSWQLQGFDKEWKTGNGQNYTTYTNVPSGKYLFKVRAAFAGGGWSTQVKAITIIITPPFWKTWWFRGCMLLFTLLLAWLFIKRREMLVAKREAEKTEIEKLKTLAYKHQLEIEQVTQYFTTSLYNQQSVDDMLWDIAKNCISRLGFEDCVIYMLDETKHRLVQKAAWGPKTTHENKIVNPIEIEPGKGIVGAVQLTGVAEIVNDTTKDKRYIVDDAMRMAEITVPVIKEGKVIGIIDCEHSQKNFYTDSHLHILNTIAYMLAEQIGKMEVAHLAREKEVALLQMSRDLSEWQLTALRAQMNPHFIFNAMNSIQQFTLTGDTDNANHYISRFSTLLRKVLYSSNQTYITLAEEIEQLELYLSLEKLRMGPEFSYSIIADEDIETDALLIPGMLIQPFVENAVKHGLPLREGAKILEINFEMPDEYSIAVTITDNGIGRKRANELKLAQTLLPHQSKGLLLVQKRLQLLEQKTGHHAHFEIVDLPEEKGTKIILQIPLGI